MAGSQFPAVAIVVGALWIMVGAAAGQALVEEAVEFEGVNFRVVRVAPARVQMRWKGENGEPMRAFGVVQDRLAKEGHEAAFLMNGGIFEPGGIPTGLYIEEGKELRPLNLEQKEGNFYLLPNGVFLIRKMPEGITASLWPTKVYVNWLKLKPGREPPVFAVQSGPLLLQRGLIHLKFARNSKSKLVRNGVGVDGKGRVVFAATAKGQVTNLYGFARLFRDSLDCQNALFLDGDLSQMAVNPESRVRSNLFGSIILVTK